MVFRVHCCADEFLRTVLTTKHLFMLDDASWEHLVACADCKHRLMRIHETHRNSRGREWPSIKGGAVLRPIGAGGGGTVWLFLNQSDGLAFEAVKVLRQGGPEESQTKIEDASLVFEAERERLARLDGGNIVVSYKRNGFTENDQRPWISMTFLRGASTSLFARHFKLSLRQRVKLARDICRSVESIHRLGVIHCDLKPGNVIVTARRRSNDSARDSLTWTVSPVDFGCSYDWHETVDGNRVEAYLSRVAGTPGYVCPELLRACDAPRESMKVHATIDVYSLGIMLFELLTGCLPWSHEQYEKLREGLTIESCQPIHIPLASKTLEIAEQNATDVNADAVNAISHKASSLVNALDYIVAKAVATDPQRRFQSAGDLANQLEAWLNYRPIAGYAESIPVFVRRWTIANPVKTTLASAVLMFLIGVSIMVNLGISPGRSERNSSVSELLTHSTSNTTSTRLAEDLPLLSE